MRPTEMMDLKLGNAYNGSTFCGIITSFELTMRIKNPPPPDLFVRHDCLEPLSLSIAEGAKALGVTRQAMNNLVSGKAGISAEMAIRREKAFGGGEETWLRMQAAYDLAQGEKQVGMIKVRRVKDALASA